MDGRYGEETETSSTSDVRHPMYRTFYISEDEEGNQMGWVIDVINDEVFARPVSFGLETTCDKEILLTEDKEGKFTSYGDGKFYITVPHDTAVTAVRVDKINAGTLDGITFDDLCALTGAVRLPSAGIGGNNATAVSLSNDPAAGSTASLAEAASNEIAVIVSLGDSFSSGEGNPPFIGQEGKTLSEKVKEEGWLAHRSTIAWPTQLQVPSDKDATSTKKVELHFAAVSGAVTENIDKAGQSKFYCKRTGNSDWDLVGTTEIPKQLDIFDTDKITGKAVDFVTLTIGGNDVGFADVIFNCVIRSSYLQHTCHKGTELENILNDTWAKVDTYMANIKRVYEAIAMKAPYAAIIVAGYPKLLDAKGAFISREEAELVNIAVSAFNLKIKDLVYECWESGMNIYFVDVENKFNDHEAYSTDKDGNDTAWIKPIMFVARAEDLNDAAISSAYSIHPNGLGVQAYAICVNEEIADYAESGEFGSNLHWKYDIRTDTLTISGAGGMPDYRAAEIGQKSIPWYRFMHRIKEVVIEDGVTSIGGCAFAKFDHLTRVEIGSTVSKIGDHAFWNCDKLSAVSDFPERLTDIGRGAFYGTALTEYHFASVPPTAREASVSKNDSSFAFGAAGDTERITLYYPADHQDSWDPDGTGKWKGYHVKSDGLSVSGTVADFETYEPVKDALVQLTRKSDKKVYEAAADGNGRFQVLVSPGDYTLQVSHEGYQTYEMTLTAEPGRDTALKVDLKPVKMATLAGSVTTEAGESLKDASITVTRDGKTIGTASSNSNGAFSLQVPAGSCEVKVTRSGYQVYRTSLLLSDTEPTNLSVTLQKVEFTWNLEGDVLTITGSGDMPHYTGYNRPPWYSVKDAVKRIEFDGEITGIGAGAFSIFTNLTSVTIPDSVTSLGEHVFSSSGLTSITIPDSVASIGIGAFNNCSNLTSVTIPNSVTCIESGTFGYCPGLTSVAIPDSVTSIGNAAFTDCTGLTSIIFSNSAISIGESAFKNCTSLTDIINGNNVTRIGNYAFQCCTSLTSVTIPDSVTSIGYRAFENCTGLTRVTIGDNCAASIGEWAFNNCGNLTSVTIPNGVTVIKDSAFYYCSGLTSAGPIGSGCSIEFGWNTSIPSCAFSSCMSLTNVTIPDGITAIGYRAFYSRTSLTSVTIPASVISIGDETFWGCTGLTGISIPDSVTSIGWQAFSGCTGLTSITIPASVTSIGNFAFSRCTGLTSIIYQGTQAQWDAMNVSLPSGVSVTCTGA